MAIPSRLDADYRVATSHDIRSWSFGAVTALYDQLVEAAGNQPASRIQEIISFISDDLTPVVIIAHDWCLAVSRTLARGLALEHKKVTEDSPAYCNQCGYILAGLQVVVCPGCGTQVE